VGAIVSSLGESDEVQEYDRLRRVVEGEDGTGGIKGEISTLRSEFSKLGNKVTLMCGLAIGAMMASGIVDGKAMHVLKAVVGLP